MQKVRVKVYGLFSLTKRTYLVMQGVGLGLVVFLFTLGLCLPHPKPAPGQPLPPVAVVVVRLLDGLPWLALLFLLAGAAETWIVLKKFARKEVEQLAALASRSDEQGEPSETGAHETGDVT